MAEQTFKSPGFFEREIEIISRPLNRNLATPVGVIGPAEKGPAFVPVTVSNSEEFIRIFGKPDTNRSAAHAVTEFFANNGRAATFCRILGTGSSSANGTVGYAGFKIDGTPLTDATTTRAQGAVQFIVADHTVNNAEHVTLGIINDNDSLTTLMDSNPSDNNLTDDGTVDDNSAGLDNKVQLVRAMIFMHKDYTLRVKTVTTSTDENDVTQNVDDVAAIDGNKKFVLVITKASDASVEKQYVVSLDPESPDYIHRVLNTDSFSMESKKHFLYADFPVDDAIASAANNNNVAVVRGAGNDLDSFGDFSSRFSAPKTTQFISQPFGVVEYPLFHVESLDDGSYASSKYKLSIADLRASTEKNYKYGTFTLQLRDLKDTDDNPIIYESYSRCSLDPNAKNYIARLIGDQKVSLSLDVDDEDEKRLVREGTFANKSTRIRVVMSDEVMRGEVPDTALPFGFKGIPALRTTSHGLDGQAVDNSANSKLIGIDDANDALFSDGVDMGNKLGFSVLPPLPYRMKVTRGNMTNSGAYFQTYLGQALSETLVKITSENVKLNMYWGLMNTRVSDINNPNRASDASEYSRLTENLCKFLGAASALKFAGAEADSFNNNKFTLAKVSFPRKHVKDITGTPSEAFLEAVYVRNADVSSELYDPVTHEINMSKSEDPFNFEDDAADANLASHQVEVGQQYIVTVVDSAGEDGLTTIGAENVVGHVFVATSSESVDQGDDGRVARHNNERASLAKILVEDVTKFNKYSVMAKFTAPFHGGFDGVNILNKDDFYFTDRASSQDVGGHAAVGGYSSALDATDGDDPMQGERLNNNAVLSYRNAVKLMTNEMVVDHNVLVIPGIRESLITDYAARRVRDFGKAIYLMDIPHYTESNERIFVSSRGLASGRADVELTSSIFDSREVDSSYVASYFPDVTIIDRGDDDQGRLTNQRLVRVPSSVVALGAIARSDDSTNRPWFAPAGFSRGALSSVRSLDVRLNAADRDTLYEARINPIANFPNNQFVIFGQKTTQIARTALDRVNVRRLMVFIKRRIQRIAQGLLFEQNDAATRKRFIAAASDILQTVQVGQGIEDFRVIMDDTNNTAEDVDNNRLNGKIIVVPTRAVEFIAMDFVITNSGVEFP